MKMAIAEVTMATLRKALEDHEKGKMTRDDYHSVVITVITLLILLYAETYTKNPNEFVIRVQDLINATLSKHVEKKGILHERENRA
jgi:hypothetical protein